MSLVDYTPVVPLQSSPSLMIHLIYMHAGLEILS